MQQFIQDSTYFGLTLTILVYSLSHLAAKKVKFFLFNPMLITTAVVIGALVIFDIDYETYQKSADWITVLLTPATICYAVPLYRQIQVLKKNWAAIIVSVLCGSLSSVVVVFLFAKLFQFTPEFYYSLIPKSVTTAIGIGISTEMNGVVAITVTGIMISGLTGHIAAPLFARLFKITHPVAKGLAIGTCAHALGTAKAIEIGEVEGAMSGLAIVIAGVMTVLWANLGVMWM